MKDNQNFEMALDKALNTIKTCLLICNDDQDAVGKLKRSISDLLQQPVVEKGFKITGQNNRISRTVIPDNLGDKP